MLLSKLYTLYHIKFEKNTTLETCSQFVPHKRINSLSVHTTFYYLIMSPNTISICRLRGDIFQQINSNKMHILQCIYRGAQIFSGVRLCHKSWIRNPRFTNHLHHQGPFINNIIIIIIIINGSKALLLSVGSFSVSLIIHTISRTPCKASTYIHTAPHNQDKRTGKRDPYLEWDSNPQPQHSSGKSQFMPVTTRPLRLANKEPCLQNHWVYGLYP
jgi:hypothetical protein